MGKVYGYVRVSSTDQHEDRQLIAMAERGIPQGRVYIDKQSGKDFARPRYRALMKKLRPGDQLCITSIDRLGRNYEEIQEQWRILTREKKDLVGTMIADLVLQVLSFVAQNERENIRKRQAEGIAAAKARGVKFGRKKTTLPPDFLQAYALWQDKRISLAEAARRCGISRSGFYYRVYKYQNYQT